MLPAISRAANPTGTGPASATRPWPSCSMAVGSTGQDGGIAASQSSLTGARSAAAANGRIRQLTPVIIPPDPAAAVFPPRRQCRADQGQPIWDWWISASDHGSPSRANIPYIGTDGMG